MPEVKDSILQSTKKILGIPAEYDTFDLDILTHINMAFDALTQLGIGPDEGFEVHDEEQTWMEFDTDLRRSSVRSYIGLKVRMMFDPPGTSFTQESMKEQIKEIEWRLTNDREGERV